MKAVSSATSWIRRLSRAGGDVLFPPECSFCRGVASDVTSSAAESAFCTACEATLFDAKAPRCERCRATVGPHLDTSTGCFVCRDERWAFDRIFALGIYDQSLREAVLRMKRGGGESLAAGLTHLLAHREIAALGQHSWDAIVPVPHHWWDRTRAAHLPPSTIATTLSKRIHLPVATHLVAKVRHTQPQAQLLPTARRKNLVNAFRYTGRSPLNGHSLLIVDDVLTTGETAHRVAKELRDAGAGFVGVAVIARGTGQA